MWSTSGAHKQEKNMGTYVSNVKTTRLTSSGAIFAGPCRILGIYYVYLCYNLLVTKENDKDISKKIFIYSILYLFLIFSVILIDNII